MAKARSAKPKKFHDIRKYWPSKTLEECQAIRAKMLEDQKGCCAICNKHESCFMKRLSVDHNHRTGHVRGLLCFRCNKFLVGRHSLTSAWQVYDYFMRFDPKGG